MLRDRRCFAQLVGHKQFPKINFNFSMLNDIPKSASKIVFLLLALTASIAFLIGVFRGTVHMGIEHFMTLASGAFAFYFSHKGDQGRDFLGK